MALHVVFDFGAVLFDWQPRRLLRQLLPERVPDEAAAAEAVAAFFQSYGGDWADFDRGRLDADAITARQARRLGWAEAEVRRVVDAVPDALQPLPDSVALLERVRALGRPVYFLSNMPAPYADELERRHAFVRAFDGGVFSGRVGLVKPDPALFALAAGRFGRAPAELLLIDDHGPNVAAARAAGWQAVPFVAADQVVRELQALGLLPAD